MKYQKKYDVTVEKLKNSELRVQSQAQKIIIIYGVIVFFLLTIGVYVYVVYKSKQMDEKSKGKRCCGERYNGYFGE